MTSGPLRVGILCVADISSKTALAIVNKKSQCVVRAVGSRSKQKAEKFIAEILASDPDVEALGYEELIQSDSLDAVYIPLPVAMKKEWVIKALNAGKHVVVEKPVALFASDYQEMLQLAYSKRKFIMDGTMFPHHHRTFEVLDYIQDESRMGTVRRVECGFTFFADDDEVWLKNDIRARKDGDPQGCLGDLGWYCIRFGLMVFGALGSRVESAQTLDIVTTEEGVPLDATCVVRFEHNRSLWFHCGFKNNFRQRFEICGSKQSILIDDLVLPKGQDSPYVLKSSGLTEMALWTFDDVKHVKPPLGSIHEVLMWKKFATICRALDATDFCDSNLEASSWIGNNCNDALITEANSWALISMTTQKVLDALIDSAVQGCAFVDIDT